MPIASGELDADHGHQRLAQHPDRPFGGRSGSGGHGDNVARSAPRGACPARRRRHCRCSPVRWSHASSHRSPAPGRPLQGGLRLRALRRPADGDQGDHEAGQRRRARTSSCSAPPAPARPPRSPGCRAGPAPDCWSCSPTRRWPRSSPTSCASFPGQRGRVLRLLLRLLPARGVRPADGHLHREGLLDQRGGRAAAALGDQLAADPARRHRGLHRLLHLRPRHPAGVRRPDDPAQGRRGARPRLDPAPPRRDPVHPQRHGVHPRHLPGPRRHPRGLPGLRGARRPHRVLRRRDRAADDAARRHRRGPHRGPGAAPLPGHALRRGPGADGARDPRHRARAGGPARRRSRSRASCWRPSGCGCARRTTSR